MFKRFGQIAAFVAVIMFMLAPIACQQAEPPADSADTAKPAGPPDGKKLMAQQPKKDIEGAVEDAGEAVEDTGEAAEDVVEEGAEAAEDVIEEGAEAVEDVTEGH